MAVTFTITNTYGFETNVTTLVVASGAWNIFTVGSNLFIRNSTLGTASPPTIIASNVELYSAIKRSDSEFIVLYTSYKTLYAIIINVASTTSSITSTKLVDSNVIGVNCTLVNTYLRITYVTTSLVLTILDYDISISFTTPVNKHEIQLSTENTYQYHIVNDIDLRDIIVYYASSTGYNVIEDQYRVLLNTITISPSSGYNNTTFIANLSEVSLTYANIVLASQSGIISNTIIDTVNNTITFKFNDINEGSKVLSFSDGVDTFIASLGFLNSPPIDINISNNTVIENNTRNTFIGTLQSIDNDLNNTFTYTLTNSDTYTDNSLFTILDDKLYTNNIFNYEYRTSYTINITSTDNNGGMFSKQFIINILDVDETALDIYLSNNTIIENKPISTLIGELSTDVIDPLYVHTYTLVNGDGDTDNALFDIINNTLISKYVFNYEVKSTYNIRIQSKDNLGGICSKPFLIYILNANDTPNNILLDNNYLYENDPVDTYIGSFSTIDDDVGDTFTYTLVSGNGDDNNASFNIVNNKLYSSDVFNFEYKNSYNILVQSTDNNGASYTKSFIINVLNVDETPTDIYLSRNDIDERLPTGTLIGTLSNNGSDPTHIYTYALVSGIGSDNNTSFYIIGNKLYSNEKYKYLIKNTYTIRIQVTDLYDGVYSKPFTIFINRVNATPENILLDNYTIFENKPVGTYIGSLTTVDPDIEDTHVYSFATDIHASDNEFFTLIGDKIYSNIIFNYEYINTYNIRLTTTDTAGDTFSKNFTIYILDNNDAPTDIIMNNTAVLEKQPKNSLISQLFTVDEDVNDTFTYALINGTGDTGNKYVYIQGDTLFTTMKLLEGIKEFSIRIRSTDSYGAYIERIFILNMIKAKKVAYSIVDSKRPSWPRRVN